jgi:hypothetical protein
VNTIASFASFLYSNNMPRRKAPVPNCQGKLIDGEPCPKTVKKGQIYCRWHDPEDESWREIYERLSAANPEERRNIVLGLIDDHPDHLLVLPERDGEPATLDDIDLSRSAILEQANLQGANLLRANLRDADLSSANLKGANLQEANLQNAALLLSTNLEHANLRHANLQGASFWGANLQWADLSDAKLQGVDLSDVDNMSNVFLSGAWLDRTRIRREKLGDGIGEEKDRHYEAAKYAYLALKQNFDDLGDYKGASWAYLKERRMEKLEARENGTNALRTSAYIIQRSGLVARIGPKQRNWREAASAYFKYVSDTFVEWLCDYGESLWRVVGWMAALLFLIGPLLFSSLGGIVWSEELTREYFGLSSWAKFWFWYRTYLLYTLDTLTTANFSGLQPINDAVKLASGFFAIAGIVLAGLLGFVAGNRIRRS